MNANSKTITLSLLLLFFTTTTHAAISWGETITAGSTEIKADHINEIRSEISSLESQLDGAGQWADGDSSAIHYNSGNVGIGVTTPAQSLDVAGSGRFTAGAPRIEFNENNTTDRNYELYLNGGKLHIRTNNDAFDAASSKMVFDDAGNVGIGTTSPGAKLDVAGSAKINAGGNYTSLNIGSQGNDRLFADNTAAKSYGGGLWFRITNSAGTGYTDNLRLAENGNIGIGVNPTQKLHVNGNSLMAGTVYLGATDTALFRDAANRIATDDQLYVRPASPNTYLYSTNTYLGSTSGDTTHLRGNRLTWNTGTLNTSGNIGMGTTSPAERLHVVGDARVSGDVQANRICDAAGGNCKTTTQLGGGTTWNFANQSLRSDSYPYTGSGSSNIMLGHLAGNNSLTGSYNILMGLFAGFGQTSASYNLIMGQQAGRYTTTGGANVMMGASSGNRNTTGTGNTFLGHITGDYNTTGYSNVMIGSSAGRVNTTGANNIVIGANAKKSSATTSNEIVIGSNSTGSGANSVTIGGIGINKTVLKGNVHATQYCDQNGANCTEAADFGVPTGAVMPFDLASCPPGWTEFTNARGRVIAGQNPSNTKFDTLRETGGAETVALTSAQLASHAHSVNPPNTTSSAVSNHNHSVNPPATNTNSTGNHRHSATDGNSQGSEGYAIDGSPTGNGTNPRTGYAGTHSHSVNIGAFNSASNGGHSHSTNIPAFNSASTGSGQAHQNLSPYVTLLMCRKN